jgi:hypothetical protein
MARSFQITFDARDPAALADFWAAALGYVLQPPPEGFDSWEAFAEATGIPPQARDQLAAAVDPDGAGPRILVQKVPEAKVAKNRCHLDVTVTSRSMQADERRAAIDAEADRLAALGATRLGDFEEAIGMWTVMQDPEGNEFCLQ